MRAWGEGVEWGPQAEGRYCLAVCYCGRCPHYIPLRPVKIQEHHLKPPKWAERYRNAYAEEKD